MLEAQNLTVKFGHQTIAVDNASIQINGGEVVTICGPNGAGKSTLLAALAGDIRPAKGDAIIDGHPIRSFRPAELARKRAVLEQAPSLSAAFTVQQLAGLSIGIEIPPKQTEEIIRRSLEDVGLADRAEDSVQLLSGGQRHRAHLARVLGQLAAAGEQQGTYLLMDEPTASLDLVHQISVMKVARRAALRGVGVLVVLHDLNLAAAFSDRIILMRQGQVVTDGKPIEALTGERLSNLYEAEIIVDHKPTQGIRIIPVFA